MQVMIAAARKASARERPRRSGSMNFSMRCFLMGSELFFDLLDFLHEGQPLTRLVLRGERASRSLIGRYAAWRKTHIGQ